MKKLSLIFFVLAILVCTKGAMAQSESPKLSPQTKTLSTNDALLAPSIVGPTVILAGKSYNYSISNPSPEDVSYEWIVTAGSEVLRSQTGSGLILFFEDITFQRGITITLTAFTASGSSTQSTLHVAVKACPTCPK